MPTRRGERSARIEAGDPQASNALPCVILGLDDELLGLFVDELLDEQEVVLKPRKRNIFRHERSPPGTGRIQNCIAGKERLIKVPVKQTDEKDPAWIQNSSAGERY